MVPDFLESIFCFANDDKGSTFAVWNDKTDKDSREMPIIVISDREEMHVVAENVVQLL